MSEQWWISCDWEFGKGTVNLAALAGIQIEDNREKGEDHRWEVNGTYSGGGGRGINIRLYKDKNDALSALALLQKFLFGDPICIDGMDYDMSMDMLREKLDEVGK